MLLCHVILGLPHLREPCGLISSPSRGVVCFSYPALVYDISTYSVDRLFTGCSPQIDQLRPVHPQNPPQTLVD